MTDQERLAAAETAYHRLMTGTSVQEVVDQNGERVRYAPANAFRLATYIAELKALLGLTKSSGPMRFWGR